MNRHTSSRFLIFKSYDQAPQRGLRVFEWSGGRLLGGFPWLGFNLSRIWELCARLAGIMRIAALCADVEGYSDELSQVNGLFFRLRRTIRRVCLR